MDNSIDDYRGHIHKTMILQVLQQIFGEILIEGRKIVSNDVFFSVTNIRRNVQNEYSELEGLLHKMVSQKPFIN